VRQTVIEMESAYLFVSAAGQGTCLAVLTTADADVGLVAYEMAVLVRRSNEHLGVGLRPGAVPTSPYVPGGTASPGAAPSPNPVYSPYSMPAGRPAPFTE
jgi:hypothetical protein